jgi:ring-1,2-phenylacetyl-CoA epoxidase subunit PaaC
VSESLVSLLTALGDDELVLGHRHSEWTGHAPHIEEDVAFSSIAQDEIGHAAAYYSIIAKLTGDDPDHLGLGRAADEYRHAVLCERRNRNWAYTLARHWLYDRADDIRLEVLEQSADDDLSALATKLRREERYHLLHADTWMRRVSLGPVEGRARLVEGVTDAFADAAGLFEPIELEDEAVKEGWLPAPSDELRDRFLKQASTVLDELGLPTAVSSSSDDHAEFVASSSGDLIAGNGVGDERHAERPGLGGRRGRHSDEWSELWDEMTLTYRNNPGASW